MAILAAMQSAAIKLQGRRPSAFFGVTDVFEMEISDLINEVAADIAKSHDWQALTNVATITGDGSTTTFVLPADYDRMLVNSALTDPTNWLWGYHGFTDINAFLVAEGQGFEPFPGGWIIYGNEMRFVPAPSTQARFPYISSYWAQDATTALKAQFTDDGDTFLLPERLLTLGLVWRWRENKKLDFTGDQEAFTKALGEYAARDRGARSYSRGSRHYYPGTYPAWPWELG
jgi:hypothetical protein